MEGEKVQHNSLLHFKDADLISALQLMIEQPLFPCKTIATLMSHRKHRLALQAHCAAFKRQVAVENSQSRLLGLPDHLLVPKTLPFPAYVISIPVSLLCAALSSLGAKSRR